ncbi:MAG: AAA family ATPase [Acidimicrobiales bacterium]
MISLPGLPVAELIAPETAGTTTAKGGKDEMPRVLGPALNVRQLVSVPPDPYDYVLPGPPAQKAGLLVGPGGSGKSRLMLAWAIGVALGTPTVPNH